MRLDCRTRGEADSRADSHSHVALRYALGPMTDDRLIVIDGNEINFEEGETVLQAAARAEIEIPTLCYDPRLDPAGACRMCLVEVEGAAVDAAGMLVQGGGRAPWCARRLAKVERNRQFILSLHLADTHPGPRGHGGQQLRRRSTRWPTSTARRANGSRSTRCGRRATPTSTGSSSIARTSASCAASAPATATRSRRSRRSRWPIAAPRRRFRPPTSARSPTPPASSVAAVSTSARRAR